MIVAVKYGGQLPLWAEVLMAAERWGVPPWVIADGGNALTWFIRWRYFEDQRARAQKNG